MADKLTKWWQIPIIFSLTLITVLLFVNVRDTSDIESFVSLYKYDNNKTGTNNNDEIIFPWNARFSSKYEMHKLNNINITGTWQCCGFGHRFHYHRDVYEYAVMHNKALLIFWPTRNAECYSNIIGNNYTINDLFPELFSFKQISVGYNGNNTDINPGDIVALQPSYILPSFDPKTAQRQPQLNEQLIARDNIVDQIIIGHEKEFTQFMSTHNNMRRREIELSHIGSVWHNWMIVNKFAKHFYLKLSEHLKPNILNTIKEFIVDKQLLSADSNLITIHIRQGNKEKGHFRFKHRRNKAKSLAYVVNEQIEYLTNKTKQNNWKIFIASDNMQTIKQLRDISKYEIITRQQIRPKKGVWFGEMGSDTPTNCLQTSIDSLVDMMLLSFGDIFLIPTGSSFNMLPQIIAAERHGIICGIFETHKANETTTQQWKCRTNDTYTFSNHELDKVLQRF